MTSVKISSRSEVARGPHLNAVWGAAFAGVLLGLPAAWMPPTAMDALLIAPFIAAGAHDIRARRIPNPVSAFIVALAFAIAAAQGEAARAVGGAAAALLAGSILAVTARGGFGVGDVKLMVGAGATVGLAHVPAFLLAMAVTGGALALGVLAIRRDLHATMPYGPAIAAALAAVLLVPAWTGLR